MLIVPNAPSFIKQGNVNGKGSGTRIDMGDSVLVGQLVHLYIKGFKAGQVCTVFVLMSIDVLGGPGQG